MNQSTNPEPSEQDGFFPTVSVIIPVYNEANRIRVCLDALEKLEYPAERFEIMIVDNNSTDGTDNIAREYDRVKVLYERDMQSPYAARNKAILESNSEIVAFTDADCVADPAWLRRLVSPFKDPEIGGTGGKVVDYRAANPVEHFIQRYLPYEHCDRDKGRFLTGLITGNAAYRREDVLAVGMFNTMFDGSDIDLSWRLQMKTGKKIVIIPEALIYHAHRATTNRLFWWQYRLGFGAVLMSTVYKEYNDSYYSPRVQTRLVLKQVRALFTYAASLVLRSVRKLLGVAPNTPEYLDTPRLFMIAESGSLLGRVTGIIKTNFYRKNVLAKKWEEPRKGHKN